jgi:hypothetical protein
MESQLSFLATGAAPAISPAVGDISPAGPAPKTSNGGSEFAQVLTGETLRTQRQQLAALGTQDTELHVVPLGSNMSVITSDAPLPDMESLAQFARQQGLNETAVQALFGPALAARSPMVNTGLPSAAGQGVQGERSSTGLDASASPSALFDTATMAEFATLASPSAALASQVAKPLASPGAPDLPLGMARFNREKNSEEVVVSGNVTPVPMESKIEIATFETLIPLRPVGVETPQDLALLATPPIADMPLRVVRFSRDQDSEEAVVSDSATPFPRGPTMEQAASGFGVTAAPAVNNAGVLSERASTGVSVNTATNASAPPPVKIDIAILATARATLAPQGTTPLATPSAAAFAPIEPALDPVVVAASAADDTVSLMPMTVQGWLGKTPSTYAAVAVSADTSTPDMGPQDALRITLAMPVPEITKRLAQMSGTGKESTWAALLASGPLAKESTAIASDTLRLEIPPDYDLTLDTALPTETSANHSDLAAHSGTAAPQVVAQAIAGGSANSDANNAQAQADHRAQQFQQVADHMGQAAAQRLIAQIERGQWKLHMRMQPAALGTVKVELDMHAGGLDASFSADNAITRELMVQGSNRLKETLAGAGMTVASVTVNRDQSRQSGGNSTPGKGRGSSTSVGAAEGTPATKVLASRVADTVSTDGLNVLA